MPYVEISYPFVRYTVGLEQLPRQGEFIEATPEIIDAFKQQGGQILEEGSWLRVNRILHVPGQVFDEEYVAAKTVIKVTTF